MQGTARYASVNTQLGIGTSRASELEAAAFVALELMGCRAPWLQPEVDRAMQEVTDGGTRELLYCNAKLAWYLDIKFSTREVRAACSPPIAV